MGSSNGKAPHIVEIGLKKYYAITEIKVHSGIPDAEKKADEATQEADAKLTQRGITKPVTYSEIWTHSK